MWASDLNSDVRRHLLILVLLASPLGLAAYFGMLWIYHLAEPNQARMALQERTLFAQDRGSMLEAVTGIEKELENLEVAIPSASPLRRPQLERERDLLRLSGGYALKRLYDPQDEKMAAR